VFDSKDWELFSVILIFISLSSFMQIKEQDLKIRPEGVLPHPFQSKMHNNFQLAVIYLWRWKCLLNLEGINTQTTFSILKIVLTPWNRVLLAKLIVPQPVKKFPTFCGARWFIAALT
jgi:hypothetical protein